MKIQCAISVAGNRTAFIGRFGKAALVVVFFAVAGCSTMNSGVSKDGAASAGAASQVGNKVSKAERKQYVAWLLGQGEKALVAGETAGAYAAYAKLLQMEPNNPRALLGLAETKLADGDAKRAAAVFARAAKTPALKPLAMQGIGLSLVKEERYAAAERNLLAAVEADGELWRAWNGLGEIADNYGNWDKARQHYEKALKANPDAATTYNNIGVSLLVQGRYREAEKQFREATDREPTLRRAKSNLRLALAWQGKYGEALTGTTKADTPVVLNNLGYIAMKKGDYQFAEAYLVQAMQLSPSYYAKAAQNLNVLHQVKKAQIVVKPDKPVTMKPQ